MKTVPQPDAGLDISDIDLARIPLEDIPALVWKLLKIGVTQSAHAFHTPSIATTGVHGPTQRTVVLRQVDAEQHLLVCHTDRRSPKVRELAQDARMNWHFYARELKLQITLGGRATVHTDTPLADQCWERSTTRSRTCYNTPLGPGIPVPEPLPGPPTIEGRDAMAATRSHFAAVACQIAHIDWLYLCADGHRRASIDLESTGKTSRWLTP